jgi:hypothetical protein
VASADVIFVSAANWDSISFARRSGFAFVQLASTGASLLSGIDPSNSRLR